MLFKDKIKIFKFFICGNIILATIIGIYAQGIASYIIGDSLSGYLYLYWLTILTVISIVLFLIVPILTYRFVKKSATKKQIFTLYLIANSFIGILTSMFSIFVLVMTCG
ncbi:MAG: hypothetical protein E6269_16500 [Clostridiales bacterium]|nr:hypothetical protein [Clostridiales bacterium]